MPSKPYDPAAAKKKPVEFFKFFFRLLDIPGWNLTLIVLYGNLFLRAGNNEDGGTCIVKIKTLAKELRLKSRTHVVALVGRLQDLGAIEVVKPRQDGKLYRVIPWRVILERHQVSGKTDTSNSDVSGKPDTETSGKTDTSGVWKNRHPYIGIKNSFGRTVERTAADAANGAAAAAIPPTKISELLDALWSGHPASERGPRSYARDRLQKVLASGGDPSVIRERHADYCRWWAIERASNSAAFVPWVGRWLEDHDWEKPPTERKQPERAKTKFQRMTEKFRQKHMGGEL